jgi:hypothetical protein
LAGVTKAALNATLRQGDELNYGVFRRDSVPFDEWHGDHVMITATSVIVCLDDCAT